MKKPELVLTKYFKLNKQLYTTTIYGPGVILLLNTLGFRSTLAAKSKVGSENTYECEYGTIQRA